MASWRTRRSASPVANMFGWLGLSFAAHRVKPLHLGDSRIAVFGLNPVSRAHYLFMMQRAVREPPFGVRRLDAALACRGLMRREHSWRTTCSVNRRLGHRNKHLLDGGVKPPPMKAVSSRRTPKLCPCDTNLRPVPYGEIPGSRQPKPAKPIGGVSTNRKEGI